MRIIQSIELITTTLVTCLLVSCERTDEKHEKLLESCSALRTIVAETQMAVLHQRFTNSNFLEGVKSEMSPTNKAAQRLQIVCDVVWVNTNFPNWLASVSTNSYSKSGIAMVARYPVAGKNYYVGIAFDENVAEQERPPVSGFVRLDTKFVAP